MSSDLDLLSQIVSADIDKSRLTNVNMNKLKNAFPDLDADTLARYLLARNNKIKKATQLLTIAEKWRSNHWPVLKSECANEINKGKCYVRGVDKEGRPLLIFRSRLHDPKDRSPEEMAKSIMWWAEQAIKACPDDKSKYTVLIDRTDASNNQDFEFVKYFAKLFQDTYPERLHRMVVFPSGMIFWSIWNVIKFFMDPVTRNKVSPCVYFYGVQEIIDDEYIPVNMGGKCTYEFNADDYLDPYPEELIQKTLELREGRAPVEGSFFKPEEGSTTPVPGEDDDDEEDEDA